MNEKNNRYETLIAKYLAGECSDAEKAGLEIWVSESPDNYRVYMHTKNIWEAAHPAFSPGEIDAEAAVRTVGKKIARGVPRAGFGRYLQRTAAILSIPLLAATVWLASQIGNRDAGIAWNEIFAPYGARTSVDLPDGSQVWINTGSSLKYPVAFSGRERIVSMTGEAFFEVQADPEHPFTVEVNGMRVTAKGTSFNINAYRDDELQVTLVAGRVGVDTGCTVHEISPRQQLTLGPAGETLLSGINPYKWVSWKEGVIAFRDDRLSYVFERLGRLYNVEFDIRDAGIGDYEYRATFRGETFDQILRLLEMSAPIRFVREQRTSGAYNSFDGEKVGVYRK